MTDRPDPKTLLSFLGCAAVVTDRAGNALAWNKQAEDFLTDPDGPPFPEVWRSHAGDGPVRRLGAGSTPTPLTAHLQLRLSRLTGQRKMDLDVVPIVDQAAGPAGFLCLITESEPSPESPARPPSLVPGADEETRKCLHDLGNALGILLSTLETRAATLEDPSELVSVMGDLRATAERAVLLHRRLGEIATVAAPEYRTQVPPTATLESRTSAPGRATPGDDASSGHLLLVEDEAPYRVLLQAVLGYQGFHVTAAADAEQAIEVCRKAERPFDAVITDYTLPGMDGLELLALLRREHPDMRALVLSGTAPERTGESGSERTDWLMKPFKNDELLARLRQILSRPEPERVQE